MKLFVFYFFTLVLSIVTLYGENNSDETTPQTQIKENVEQNAPSQNVSHDVCSKDIKIVPHTAEYQVTLVKNNDPEIVDVAGNLVITVKEVDGHIVEQHSIIKIKFDDDSEKCQEMFLASWESIDGKEYTFSSKTTEDDDKMFVIRGKALSHDDKEGSVHYQSPSATKITLQPGTHFPFMHLKKMLQATQENHMTYNAMVFDGSNEDMRPVDVRTTLSPVSMNYKINGSADVDFKEAVMMKMAVYDPNDKGMDPQCIITQVVQKNGIILSIEIESKESDFTTRAQLIKVDL